MNRRQRREHARRRTRLGNAIETLMDASEADGRPWRIHGLTAACADCNGTAEMRGQGRHGPVVSHIHHEPGCPAANGITPYRVPADTTTPTNTEGQAQ